MITGKLTCMNHASWVFVFLTYLIFRGNLGQRQKWVNLEGNCFNFGKLTLFPQGIFCANFSWSVRGFSTCKRSWCASCYTLFPELKFHKQEDPRGLQPNSKLDAKWKSKKVKIYEYKVARPGDILLCPFQCDLCVFRRLRQEEPIKTSHSDNLLFKYIRRANLDAFWSRATGTVTKECGNVKRNIEDLKMLGLSGPYYDPGPSPPNDSCGYEAAISLLVDSQRKGNYADDHKNNGSPYKNFVQSFQVLKGLLSVCLDTL